MCLGKSDLALLEIAIQSPDFTFPLFTFRNVIVNREQTQPPANLNLFNGSQYIRYLIRFGMDLDLNIASKSMFGGCIQDFSARRRVDQSQFGGGVPDQLFFTIACKLGKGLIDVNVTTIRDTGNRNCRGAVKKRLGEFLFRLL